MGKSVQRLPHAKPCFSRSGRYFFVYLFKSAVIEVNVFQLAICSSRKEGEFKSARVNVIEVKRLNGRAGGGLFIENMHLDGIAVNAVHDNVGKIQVFDKSGLSALVGYSGIAEVGNKYAYAARSVRHDQVGEGAVSDGSVAQPAYPDAAGVTCKRAVGDGNSFANLVLGQRVIVGAYHYAVVAANYVAVGNENVFGAIYVYAVIVGVLYVGLYFAAVEENVLAVAYPVRPARRLINHSHVRDFHVSAPREKYHSGRGRRVNAAESGARYVVGYGLYKTFAVAIDGSSAGDGDIYAVLRVNKAPAAPSWQIFVVDSGVCLLGIILAPWRTQ